MPARRRPDGGRARAVALRAARATCPIRRSPRSTGRASAAAPSSRWPATIASMSDSKKAQIGLPEVRLGIFPAWGGCTRLPRVVGLAAALDLILTGKSLDARRAKRIGLVDEACRRRSSRTGRAAFARGKLGGAQAGRRREHRLARRPCARRHAHRPTRRSSRKAREGVMEQTGGHYPAPLEALEVDRGGLRQGRSPTAWRSEARHIGLIFGGEVQRNLLNIFFLTEEVKKETGVADPSVRPRGGSPRRRPRRGRDGRRDRPARRRQGPAGADEGHPARGARPRLRRGGRAVWKEARDEAPPHAARDEPQDGPALRRGSTTRASRRCEVTIEAVVEKLAVKRAVLKEWEAGRSATTAIFASNTSTLPITEIAAGALEPGAGRRACTSSIPCTGCRSSR